jgi:hypothetical protein
VTQNFRKYNFLTFQSVWALALTLGMVVNSCQVTYIKNSSNINTNEKIDSMKTNVKAKFGYKPHKGTKFTMPSPTVENDHLTVEEILKMQSSGVQVPGMQVQPMYMYDENIQPSDDDMPIQKMTDLTDIDDVTDKLHNIREKKAKFENAKKTAVSQKQDPKTRVAQTSGKTSPPTEGETEQS